MKRLISLFLTLLVYSPLLVAQPPSARLKGPVLDTSGMPIPKVQVTLQNATASYETLSGEGGRLQIVQTKPSDAPFTVRLTAKGDELSILFPVKPSVYRFNRAFSYTLNGQLINEERIATAYANGVVYFLDLLSTGSPRRAMQDYMSDWRGKDKSIIRRVTRQALSVSGNAGQQDEFRRTSYVTLEPYYRREQYFTTKHYLCVISAVARDGVSPEMNEFFSSLKFGADAGRAAVDTLSQVGKGQTGQASFTGKVYNAKEVTRQAILVWKPELEVLLQNIADDIDIRRREIPIEVTLTSEGEVADLKFPQIMSREVMAIAADMARNLRFIPAELNGRPVSQRITLKFDLRDQSY